MTFFTSRITPTPTPRCKSNDANVIAAVSAQRPLSPPPGSALTARLPELLKLVDHLIVSENFALQMTRTISSAAAAKKLWRDDRAAVVITCGASGGWFLTRELKSARRFKSFHVRAVDTTGCGDVFHGAYAVALARGFPILERLRFAAAAAALKATRRGGQAGIPTRSEVERFLARNCFSVPMVGR